jgi:hypothetical protein
MNITTFLLAAVLAGDVWTIPCETVSPIACNMKPGKRGGSQQLPWREVKGAITRAKQKKRPLL